MGQKARKIEQELTYPGQIKVTVIRENRFIEFAKWNAWLAQSMKILFIGDIMGEPGRRVILKCLHKVIAQHQVDLVIDGGHCGLEPTTVVDLTEHEPKVIRVGCGDPTPFMEE